MVDITKLKEKLGDLKGYDIEACDKEERAVGNNAVVLNVTPSFQARLAARALGVNPHDIKELPAKKYSQVTSTVMNFLFVDSESEETPPTESEA